MPLPQTMSRLASIALLTMTLAETAMGSSWIDCIDHNYDVISGTKRQGTCEGYPYNYPDHNIDYSWKIEATNLKDTNASICQYKQSDATYNNWRHELHATPGDTLYFGYKPDHQRASTTWGIYWSGVTGHELTMSNELTSDRLVDGKRKAFNCGAAKCDISNDEKPCIGSFSIPSIVTPGRYQMVWYWTTHDHDEKNVAYSSCFDVIIDGHPDEDVGDPNCNVAGDTKTPVPTSPTTTTPAPSPPATTIIAPLPTTTTPGPTTEAPTVVPVPATVNPSTPSPFTAPLVAVTYNGVGGNGSYGKVTAMNCPSTTTCIQSDFHVDSPLAPFDEDLSLSLRGPLDIDGISVFTLGDGNEWSRVSSYSKPSTSSENLVFLNNKGDPLKSGVFDTCNGNSQSYATSDGKTAATESTAFTGVLDDGVEVNIMSAMRCGQSGTCGVTRGIAHNGWSGNHKIFMIKAKMPTAPSGGVNLPAIWLLNGQIVRTAQYGCNCRGIGDTGKWKGGCGELDVAEVLPSDPSSLTSTIYSFKGSRGTSSYTLRPLETPVVFVVILTQQSTSALGMIQILLFKPDDIEMMTPPTATKVAEWLTYRNGVVVNFDI